MEINILLVEIGVLLWMGSVWCSTADICFMIYLTVRNNLALKEEHGSLLREAAAVVSQNCAISFSPEVEENLVF